MTDLSLFEGASTPTICDDDVANYLKDHPDFFLRQNELLVHLRIPHLQRGAVSLVEIQLEKLRERVVDLEEEITQLMSIASGNERVFRAFSYVHQALFSASTEKEIRQSLDELAESLNLTVNLRFYETAANSLRHRMLDRNAVEKLKSVHFCGQRIYLGRLRKVNGEQFVSPSPELGSYALVPIGQTKELGFLAFASNDGGHFQPSMDTSLLEQLALHIAIILTKWQLI